jgi:hypothetical protein
LAVSGRGAWAAWLEVGAVDRTSCLYGRVLKTAQVYAHAHYHVLQGRRGVKVVLVGEGLVR